jgi:hypothetical protein
MNSSITFKYDQLRDTRSREDFSPSRQVNSQMAFGSKANPILLLAKGVLDPINLRQTKTERQLK